MNQHYLVGIAALIVIAVGLLLRWYHQRFVAGKRERHIKLLQKSLGIKPGPAGGPEKKPAQDDGTKSKDPPKKPMTTALMVRPDPDVLRTNGAWVNEVAFFTGDPNPLFGTRNSVRDAQSRARALHDKCSAARKQKNWQLCQELIDDAFQELNSGMRRDHWFAAYLHNQHGCIRYEQGFYVEAREIWERAEMVCHEWPVQCGDVLKTIEGNLKLVTDMLGF